jgi:hypothetical protein
MDLIKIEHSQPPGQPAEPRSGLIEELTPRLVKRIAVNVPEQLQRDECGRTAAQYYAARAAGFRDLWVANGNALRQMLVRDFKILIAMLAAFDGADLFTYACVITRNDRRNPATRSAPIRLS